MFNLRTWAALLLGGVRHVCSKNESLASFNDSHLLDFRAFVAAGPDSTGGGGARRSQRPSASRRRRLALQKQADDDQDVDRCLAIDIDHNHLQSLHPNFFLSPADWRKNSQRIGDARSSEARHTVVNALSSERVNQGQTTAPDANGLWGRSGVGGPGHARPSPVAESRRNCHEKANPTS